MKNLTFGGVHAHGASAAPSSSTRKLRLGSTEANKCPAADRRFSLLVCFFKYEPCFKLSSDRCSVYRHLGKFINSSNFKPDRKPLRLIYFRVPKKSGRGRPWSCTRGARHLAIIDRIIQAPARAEAFETHKIRIKRVSGARLPLCGDIAKLVRAGPSAPAPRARAPRREPRPAAASFSKRYKIQENVYMRLRRRGRSDSDGAPTTTAPGPNIMFVHTSIIYRRGAQMNLLLRERRRPPPPARRLPFPHAAFSRAHAVDLE
ncbi:hypothetical protein EVAR_31756_1 [Eumeta japonica]|uniref:Uncharacterized protein n=1 Tax=Eumeta variegata TaxID=151549 RepID=A0A4C1W469_EUMVA|nr:hypothetical protein EVAR_31756_1 [Eumeta japonica]